jgi:hypothetical protein
MSSRLPKGNRDIYQTVCAAIGYHPDRLFAEPTDAAWYQFAGDIADAVDALQQRTYDVWAKVPPEYAYDTHTGGDSVIHGLGDCHCDGHAPDCDNVEGHERARLIAAAWNRKDAARHADALLA